MGNPGRRYADTRHNVGSAIVGSFAQKEGIPVSKKGFSSLWGRGVVDGQEVLFLFPQTFMNRSGEAVGAAKDYFKVSERNLLVVHDDLDLPLGRVKIDFGAGPAGHRGVTSIVELLGSKEFYRIRVGIGRPATKEEVEGFVLSPFEKGEEDAVQKAVAQAEEILRQWIRRSED